MTSFVLILLFAAIIISDGILADDNNDKDNWLIFALCYNNSG